jgi:Fic family protein
MSKLVRRRWEPEPGQGGRQLYLLGFDYDAYLPDPIANLALQLPMDLAGELETTTRTLADLQGLASFSGHEALSRQLLRAESIGSSRIEGLQISQRRLARAIIDPEAESETARAVVGNIAAMDKAIQIGTSDALITVESILDIHRHLMAGTRDAAIGGEIRTSQNWIGGSDWSPKGAEFIPPPETEVLGLLEDLCAFLNRTDLPAIMQAAIGHAQFETIHPFADGNGRVGRALIHVVLKRRGATPTIVPPISLVLATNAGRYIDGLNALRSGNLLDWCALFTRVLQASVQHAERFRQDLQQLAVSWMAAAGNPRAHSAMARLIHNLPAQPVIDLKSAMALTGASDEAVRNALNDLAAAGILVPVTIGKTRNRVWEARELLGLVDSFEWDLATPTKPDQPRRAAPPKPKRPKQL